MKVNELVGDIAAAGFDCYFAVQFAAEVVLIQAELGEAVAVFDNNQLAGGCGGIGLDAARFLAVY